MKRSGRIAPKRKRYPAGFWAKRRAEALARDGGRCVKCGAVATEVDHVETLGMGRSRHNPKEPRNALHLLASMCRSCHEAKTLGRKK